MRINLITICTAALGECGDVSPLSKRRRVAAPPLPELKVEGTKVTELQTGDTFWAGCPHSDFGNLTTDFTDGHGSNSGVVVGRDILNDPYHADANRKRSGSGSAATPLPRTTVRGRTAARPRRFQSGDMSPHSTIEGSQTCRYLFA